MVFLREKRSFFLNDLKRNFFRDRSAVAFLFFVFCCWPSSADAAAAALTLGQIVCNIKTNMTFYPRILSAIAYVVAGVLTFKGVLILKKHPESPGQPHITSGIAHLVGGAGLFSLPAFVGMIQMSIFGSLGGAGSTNCVPGAVTGGAGGTVGLDQMMQNFVKNIHGPIFVILSVICIIVGLTFIVSALLKGAKTGTDPKAANPKDIVAYLIFGAILVSIGTTLPTMLQTIFGAAGVSNMSTIPSLINWSSIVGGTIDTTAADNTVRAVLAFVQIIGAISFVRGWLLLKKAVEGGQATIPQGFTHIIGGAMAINIDIMLKAIDKTFGTGIIA